MVPTLQPPAEWCGQAANPRRRRLGTDRRRAPPAASPSGMFWDSLMSVVPRFGAAEEAENKAAVMEGRAAIDAAQARSDQAKADRQEKIAEEANAQAIAAIEAGRATAAQAVIDADAALEAADKAETLAKEVPMSDEASIDDKLTKEQANALETEQAADDVASEKDSIAKTESKETKVSEPKVVTDGGDTSRDGGKHRKHASTAGLAADSAAPEGSHYATISDHGRVHHSVQNDVKPLLEDELAITKSDSGGSLVRRAQHSIGHNDDAD